jgi:hypothetical protein
MPIKVVTMKPAESSPGLMARATSPATKPIRMVQTMLIRFLVVEEREALPPAAEPDS